MPARVYSLALLGLEGFAVTVEADILGSGNPTFTLVGLPDAAMKEARNRVEAALKNSGLEPPYRHGRVTLNLAPADMPKTGPVYDLPVALAFLLASGQVSFSPEKRVFLGELGLDGSIRSLRGALPLALAAQEEGFEEVYAPEENAAELQVVEGITIFPVKNLRQLVLHLEGKKPLTPLSPQWSVSSDSEGELDMALIHGQHQAKRALEIAAAGGHNILFSGPPGTGKTLLSRTLATILPPLSREEALEVTKIHSVAGTLRSGVLTQRPFRSPHHTASSVAIIGGGSVPRPGEVSLAHRGVLFLDEFPEFSRSVLESLRQPLEDGFVTISRVQLSVRFPAQCMLVASMNPCPCGKAGDPKQVCTCSPSQITRYRQKISGPLLDRIDLHVDVPRMEAKEFSGKPSGDSSKTVRERVTAARERQRKRYEGQPFQTNRELQGRALHEHCRLDAKAQQFLQKAIETFALSGRGYHRILRLARTIADMAGDERVEQKHLAEAIQYRVRAEGV